MVTFLFYNILTLVRLLHMILQLSFLWGWGGDLEWQLIYGTPLQHFFWGGQDYVMYNVFNDF